MSYERQHLIMNPAGVYQFRELEMMILDHLKSTGQLNAAADPAQDRQQNAIGLGGMMIDLIMVADNLGLDVTQCLAAAYLHRTGKASK